MTPEQERITHLRGHMDTVTETTTVDGTAEVLKRIYIKDMQETLDGWQAALKRIEELEGELKACMGTERGLFEGGLPNRRELEEMIARGEIG